MRLINQTRNTCLASEVVFAGTPFSRIKGLLGKNSLPDGCGLVIKPCNCIHTFFMRFAIDVLFVDRNNQVVNALDRIGPFRFSKLHWKSQIVVELPTGKINSTQTKRGDQLQFLD